MTMTDTLGLAGFVAVCFAAASSGAIFKPGAWYAQLAKPAWCPPNWAFPVVWTILFVMIAVAGWMVWREAGFSGAPVALALYGVQLVLNAAWSAIFFGLRRPDLALVELAVFWLAIAGTIIAFHAVSPAAALVLAPYLVWVTIAAALNASIWRLNRDRPGFGAASFST